GRNAGAGEEDNPRILRQFRSDAGDDIAQPTRAIDAMRSIPIGFIRRGAMRDPCLIRAAPLLAELGWMIVGPKLFVELRPCTGSHQYDARTVPRTPLCPDIRVAPENEILVPSHKRIERPRHDAIKIEIQNPLTNDL